MTRLVIAALTCIATPTLICFAYMNWRRAERPTLTTWRNGVGLTAMFLISALWLIQTVRWLALSVTSGFIGFLGPNFRDAEMLLTAWFAYPALPFALALKGVPRLETIAAWVSLTAFYGAFWYT